MISSVAELKSLIGDTTGSKLASRFRKLRKMQKDAQQFYDMEYTFKIYEGYERIKLPTGRQLIETFLSHLFLDNPKVSVTPFSDNNTQRKKADKQRDYYEALLRYYLMQTDNPIVQAATDIGLRGEAYFKVLYDVGVIEGMPAEVRDDKNTRLEYLVDHIPLKIMCPDPMNCFPPTDDVIDCRPVEMIEIYNVYAGQVRRIWEGWKSSKQDTDIVQFVEYWRDDARCFLADGKPVTEGIEENSYKISPYVHVYSGLGTRTPNKEPEKRAVNLIFEAQDLIKQQSRFYSYHDKALAFASCPIVSVPLAQAEYTKLTGMAKLTISPGAVFYGDTKPTIEWAAKSIPEGIQQAIAINDMMINKSQPAVLRGEVARGVEGGLQTAYMLGEARLSFGIPMMNLKTLLSRSLQIVKNLIVNAVDEELPIWADKRALTIGKKDCEGAFLITADFETESEEALLNQAVGLQRLRQGGDISLRTALELNPLIKNPRQEYNRIKAEQIQTHPSLQRKVAVDALNALGETEQAQIIGQEMQAGEAGAARKAASTGIPEGGAVEEETPENVVARAIQSQHKKATSG